MKNKYERIKKAIEEMNDRDIISLHNAYCDKTSIDKRIYLMDDFDEVMNGVEPWEVARSCFYGRHFCPVDDYFFFNGYGNIESINYILHDERTLIYLSDIAQYIIDNSDCLGNMEIADILDE